MPRIDELFAFITEDTGPDDEGICAMRMGNFWVPMVGADMERMEALRPAAEKIAKVSGHRIRLVRFAVRLELE